jgi:hypothetical protein
MALASCLVVLVITNTADSDNATDADTRVGGIWVASVKGSYLKRCPDGQRIWAWEQNSLYLVDCWGKERSVALLAPGPISYVSPCRGFAWVVAGKKLYQVWESGKVTTFTNLEGEIEEILTPAKTEPQGWVLARVQRRYYGLDPDKNVVHFAELDGRSVADVWSGDNPEQPGWAITSGDTTQLYRLQLDGHAILTLDNVAFPHEFTSMVIPGLPLWFVTGDSPRQRLQRIGRDGVPVPCAQLDGIQINQVRSTTDRNGTAWVMTDGNKKIYFVDDHCAIAGGAPLLQSETGFQLVPSGDKESHAWVLPQAQNGIYLLHAGDEPKTLMEDKRVIKLEVSRGGKYAWTILQGLEVNLVSIDPGATPVRLQGLDDLDVSEIHPAIDETLAWLKTTADEICLNDRAGLCS